MKQKSAFDRKGYLLLHAGVLLYSLAAVFSKFAAGKETFSIPFFLFYGLSLLTLAFYSFIWQQALRRFPLSLAYANRAAAIGWNLLLGALLFRETVGLRQAVGIAVLFAGVLLVVTGDE